MSDLQGDCKPSHPGDITKHEAELGIVPSHGISLDVPGSTELGRPPLIQHLSSPAYQSPLRHHRRGASQHRVIKETLNAKSEYTNNEEDGKGEHHINQYIIKDEIGRGSFGAVHLAVDQYGTEYAVKEFSKSRLRKRAQSNILRRTPGQRRRPGHLAAGLGLNAPLHRHSASDLHNAEEAGNPLYLIKEEIAIMKKLNHPNLVNLIEVLDDPEEDSLYMVLEMCKKGVVMKVGLGEKADPYDSERCRHWFRDLILGIEYLHAQGVVHRDIKPDNLLLTEDDVLKIVDFGVSEMFEKQSEMMTAKSAGSPAFLPPELCVTRHGDISGKAADIWSMGISLYCLRFGKIPFERSGVLELYEAIKNDDFDIHAEHEPEFNDLMRRILEKDPEKRIKMAELRDHPWVTRNGQDPLLSAEENTADIVELPSAIEVNHAITAKMKHLMFMMKSVQKFKNLLDNKRPNAISTALGKHVRTVNPNLNIPEESSTHLQRPQSVDIHDRRLVETALVTEGVHHDMAPQNDVLPPLSNKMDASVAILSAPSSQSTSQESIPKSHQIGTESLPTSPRRQDSGEKGHAHDPLDGEPLFLGIGSGGIDDDGSLEVPLDNMVAESPTAAEFSIYDTAYQQEVERIRASQGHTATVYLTRRVDNKKEYKADENMIDAPTNKEVAGQPHEGWKGVLDKAREKHEEVVKRVEENSSGTGAPAGSGFGTKFHEIAAQAVENTRGLATKGGDLFGTFVGRMGEKKSAE